MRVRFGTDTGMEIRPPAARNCDGSSSGLSSPGGLIPGGCFGDDVLFERGTLKYNSSRGKPPVRLTAEGGIRTRGCPER